MAENFWHSSPKSTGSATTTPPNSPFTVNLNTHFQGRGFMEWNFFVLEMVYQKMIYENRR
jgi:hypothetical protein